ncbi:hypothetical protein [Orientia tsutsugamushi]|uniref:hypothetical protein n=1 Tax=Orientia tsutsugamushi TaxID=784 RepID=UPI00123A69C8|nr:hypothetical protein [Orientia tsutsugamushi]QES96600.1 hypothetical protein F0363_09085 [Orientia tsutsugamushi]
MFSDIGANLGSIGHGGNSSSAGGGYGIYSALLEGAKLPSVDQLLSESHVVKMLTFGLDSIFPAAAASFGQTLKSVLQFADLSGCTSGLSIPLTSIFSTKGKSSSRGASR